jgi:hypothetical protein
MAVIRAKLRVNQVIHYIDNLGQIESEEVKLTAVYDDDPESDNAQWSKWTPSANLSITISNPAAIGKLTKDHEFYIDFTPVKVTG